jgi:hypothetical protein
MILGTIYKANIAKKLLRLLVSYPTIADNKNITIKTLDIIIPLH